MGNSLRCCLACVLPCGALDLIRIVHLNGYVEEITHPITAGEVLKNNPNHVLSKPSSSLEGGVVRRILILSPHSELKRGSIYFLIPSSSLPENKRPLHHQHRHINSHKIITSTSKKPKKTKRGDDPPVPSSLEVEGSPEKKKVPQKEHRRTASVGDWRPNLESIFEEQ